MTKVLVSLPEELLADIDRAASRTGITRSAFLQDAARRALGVPSRSRIADALERRRAALAGSGPFESATLVRRSRDERDAADRRL